MARERIIDRPTPTSGRVIALLDLADRFDRAAERVDVAVASSLRRKAESFRRQAQRLEATHE